MVQKAAYLKSGLTIKPSISKTLNGSVSYTRQNIFSPMGRLNLVKLRFFKITEFNVFFNGVHLLWSILL